MRSDFLPVDRPRRRDRGRLQRRGQYRSDYKSTAVAAVSHCRAIFGGQRPPRQKISKDAFASGTDPKNIDDYVQNSVKRRQGSER